MTNSEQEYMAFCATVKKDAIRIMAMAANGRDHEMIVRAGLALADLANAQQHQFTMQHERQAGTYDLAVLGVNASEPFDSEIGYEDRG